MKRNVLPATPSWHRLDEHFRRLKVDATALETTIEELETRTAELEEGGGGASELEKITEGANTGWRILGANPANYGNIGDDAKDFTVSTSASSTIGATGTNAFAEGEDVVASGYASHAEGFGTTASNEYTHAEGEETVASGSAAHSEGQFTEASGASSHAEGFSTYANGTSSHAEGSVTTADGSYSHSEGQGTFADGTASHAEGMNTTANGTASHSGGVGNTAETYAETVIGSNSVSITGNKFTVIAGDPAFRVGIGADAGNKADGFRVYKNGAQYMYPTTTLSIFSPTKGFLIYNDTTKKLASFDGLTWRDYAHIGTDAPISATATGITGEIRITPTFTYTCVATNTWVRSVAATW